MQKEELLLSLLAKARRLADAIYQCGMDYVQLSQQSNQLNSIAKGRLREAATTGLWAFEKYYENYSLKNYLQNYFSQQVDLPPHQRVVELNAPMPIVLCSAPIDLPIAILVGSLGFGAKLSADTLKLARDTAINLAKKAI